MGNKLRPKWWWLNPWLYAMKLEQEYERRCSEVYDLALEIQYPKERVYTPHKVITVQSIAGKCASCGLNYIKAIIEERSTTP